MVSLTKNAGKNGPRKRWQAMGSEASTAIVSDRAARYAQNTWQIVLFVTSGVHLAGVIANLHIYFAPTSLFNTLVMLVLLVGGLVLIARALRAA